MRASCLHVVITVCLDCEGEWGGVAPSDAGSREGTGLAKDDDSALAGDIAFHQVLHDMSAKA